jgi:hypothetical protein
LKRRSTESHDDDDQGYWPCRKYVFFFFPQKIRPKKIRPKKFAPKNLSGAVCVSQVCTALSIARVRKKIRREPDDNGAHP